MIKVYYYPVNHYKRRERYYFISIGLLEGSDKIKKQFLTDLRKLKGAKKDRRFEMLEIEGDFFVLITSHTANRETETFVRFAYNPALIHFKPVEWHEDGWEEWHVAAMEKKDILDLLDIGEHIYELKLLYFGKKKIKNFGFMTLLPGLTKKQEGALKLAIGEGYYSYPRKTEVQKLAKLAKLSFSTFQAHLRKGENKIVPYVMRYSAT